VTSVQARSILVCPVDTSLFTALSNCAAPYGPAMLVTQLIGDLFAHVADHAETMPAAVADSQAFPQPDVPSPAASGASPNSRTGLSQQTAASQSGPRSSRVSAASCSA
jgi:hypothetical protein